MDQFGLNVNRATYTATNTALNNTQGIFIEQNSRGEAEAGELLKYDQLLKITWTRPSQNSPVQEIVLTENIEEAKRMIRRIPINIMCTIYFRRTTDPRSYVVFNDGRPISV